MKKRVLLIHPNYRRIYAYLNEGVPMLQPPMGLAYIASSLQNAGHVVSIVDGAHLDMGNAQIVEQAVSFSPDFVGISATTNLIEAAAALAGEIKKKLDAPIIIGGAHSSIMPERTLEEFSSFDMAVKGEGEYVMLDLCAGREKNGIAGLTYRDLGKIIKNQDRPPIEDLDALPFPARDLLPNDMYWSPAVRKYPYANILTSRGCPYSCIFCSDHLIHGKKFRARSVGNIMEEVDFLVSEYGIRELNIIDDNFTFSAARASEFCELLMDRGYGLGWRVGGGVRPDRVSRDLLILMKKAGCYFIALGIESGADEILKNIRKGTTTAQISQAVRWAKEAGLHTFGFFIIGNLGETRQKIEKTIAFAKSLKLDDVQFQLCLPFPGTEMYERVTGEGKLYIKRWQDYAAFDKPIFEHGELTIDLLKEMQVKAYRSYYLRPSVIVKKIFEIRSLKQLQAYCSAGLGVLKLKR